MEKKLKILGEAIEGLAMAASLISIIILIMMTIMSILLFWLIMYNGWNQAVTPEMMWSAGVISISYVRIFLMVMIGSIYFFGIYIKGLIKKEASRNGKRN